MKFLNGLLKHKCVVCHEEATRLYGHKTDYGYYTETWCCEKHFYYLIDLIRKGELVDKVNDGDVNANR